MGFNFLSGLGGLTGLAAANGKPGIAAGLAGGVGGAGLMALLKGGQKKKVGGIPDTDPSPRFGGGQNADGTMSLAGGSEGGGGPDTGGMPTQIQRPAPSGNDDFALGQVAGQGDAAIAKGLQKRSFFDSIGDKLNEPGVRAALLRSGATTLSTGDLGQGIMAGANFMDQRRTEGENTRRWEAGHDIDVAKLSNDTARVGIDRQGVDDRWRLGALGLVETKRHNQSEEKNQVRGQQVQERGDTMHYQAAIHGDDTSRANNMESNSTAQRGQDIDSMDRASQNRSQESIAGMPARAQPPRQTQRLTFPGQPEKNNWFSADEPAVPKRQIETQTDAFPSPVPSAVSRLKANPTPQERQFFEQMFGPGSSAPFLGGQ